MPRENINDLVAFLAVARDKSFTKAAARIGVSQSALSHTIRALETRLGIRLLTRTTRSVSPTEAGERLLNAIGPHFEEIEAELAALTELRDKPAGTVRITAGLHCTNTLLWPKLKAFLSEHPDIRIEVSVDYGLVDIAAQRFDAGIRLGESVAKDMIAVRIGPDFRMTVVATPTYFAKQPKPKTPQDLTAHNCINLRLPTHGGIYAWEFEKGSRELRVRVEGQLVFNASDQILRGALEGCGVAYLPEDSVAPNLRDGSLVSVLEDWCTPFPGYHLYYPSSKRTSPALSRLVEALRYRS